MSGPDWLIGVTPWIIQVARSVAVLAGLCILLDKFYRWPDLILCLSVTVIHGLISLFPSEIWTYNTHLILFLGLSTIGLPRPEKRSSRSIMIRLNLSGGSRNSSYALAFMQIWIVLIYFQTGLSKIIHSGPEWFLSGRTAMTFTAFDGTYFGIWILEYPWIFRLGSTLTVLLEIAFPLFLIVPRLRLLFLAGAFLFHTSTLVIMGISFWHLWILFPALFLFRIYPSNLYSIPNIAEHNT